MPGRDRIERVKQKAHEYEKNYGGCAQAVLGALQDEFKIGNKESFKAASFLSGGVARRGETCGAVIGLLSALALLKGRERIEDNEAYKPALAASVETCARFIAELKLQLDFKGDLNSALCKHIQEHLYGRAFDLTNPAEFQAFQAAGGHSDNGCPRVCGVAAQIAAEEILKLI